ncbi:MAG: hypothetical protein A2190_04580 [Lysobacterales bacterium RIFOXYA1_FULL_69_10]|nr:MAG: hypothetical protein A2190_04580 [Xanthomonadales bacterium RIFOXYA1_FULL_69_10]
MRKPPTPKPWNRSNPKPRAARTTLAPELVEQARARAEAAGRRYPNLVDNMWAAQKARQAQSAAPDDAARDEDGDEGAD